MYVVQEKLFITWKLLKAFIYGFVPQVTQSACNISHRTDLNISLLKCVTEMFTIFHTIKLKMLISNHFPGLKNEDYE